MIKTLVSIQMNKIKFFLFASLLVSVAGCQTYREDQSRRSKITQFIINHPMAAHSIGAEDNKSNNITSNAIRLSLRTNLDNQANGDGRGTQVNAIGHTLWQAAISSQFDSKIAEEAENAYLSDTELREGKTDYYSRLAADQAVDLRNGRIGRNIGNDNPHADMKKLSQNILFYYNNIGLWTASQVITNGRKVWRISQNKLNNTEYNKALQNIEPLNSDGMTHQEQEQYRNNELREIKKSVRAVVKVED